MIFHQQQQNMEYHFNPLKCFLFTFFKNNFHLLVWVLIRKKDHETLNTISYFYDDADVIVSYFFFNIMSDFIRLYLNDAGIILLSGSIKMLKVITI